jgi:multiple sugar transport system substrate-binding protein
MKKFATALRAAACAAALVLAPALPARAAEPLTIHVWHGLSGAHEEVFAALVERFNAEQKEVRVVADKKGDEDQTLTAGLEAARTRQAPHLLQVPDDRATQLAANKAVTKPVADLTNRNTGADARWFAPAASSFVRDARGRLLAFPFMSSAPVLFYNKDAYRQAGLDPDKPPRTWRDMQAHLLKLHAVSSCPYATSRQAWIHVENLASWHNQPVATRNNGMDGAGAQLTFNDLLHVRHLALMRSWVTSQLFKQQSAGDGGDARFASGECATLTGGTSALGAIQRDARFSWAVAPLPFYEEEAREPGSALVGGSSFWVMGGKRAAEYKAIEAFLSFLAKPVVAAEWHEKTGFLPLSEAAYLASRKGHYDKVPGLEAEMARLAGPTGRLRGIRMPHYHRVRDIMDDELAAAWQGKKPPKQALDDAVKRGNAALKGGK